jgi:glutathione S-transferase
MELNPEGMVPVLECYGGAVVIHDSDLILDQIALGVVEGGKRLAMADEEASLVQGWRTSIHDMLPVGKAAVHGDASQRKMLMEVLSGWDCRVVGPYLCGDKVTLADCGAFPFVWRLDREFGLESMDCKRLKSWLTTCEANAAFGKTIESSWWWWW